MVRAKGARDLQAPPLQLPLGMIGLAPAADLDGSVLSGEAMESTAWAGQWVASPRRVGDRQQGPAMPWGLGAKACSNCTGH
jgi:hypothetical protein